ncbi:MAG: VCBS domain-containing protein, partial [Pseudomonadota bacterium]
DAPTISFSGSDTDVAALTETDAGLSVSETLTVSDLDTTDVVTASPNGLPSIGGTGAGSLPVALDANALAAFFSVSPSPVISNTANDGTLTWSFDSGTEAFDFLAQGETLELTYTVEVEDSQGVTAHEDVVITITGSNDAPVLTVSPTGAVTEDTGAVAAILSTSGSVGIADVDVSDTHTVSTAVNTPPTWSAGVLSIPEMSALQSGFNANGSVWTYNVLDSAVQFLGAGETITIVYDVTVTDGIATDTETVTITINGTNDAPVVTVGPPPAAVAESDVGVLSNETFTLFDLLSQATDADANDTPTIDEGSVIFAFATGSDVMTGPHHFLVGGTGNATGITVDTANYDFLGAGEQAIIDVTFDVVSGLETVPRTVQITITGTNDAPVLTVDTNGSVTEDVGVDGLGMIGTTGTLSFTDVDVNDSPVVTDAANGAPVWSGGDITTVLTAVDIAALQAGFEATGTGWTYDVDNSLVQFLGTGETITLEFDVTVDDQSGTATATDTETVTIVIEGADEPVPPVLVSGNAALPYTQGDGAVVIDNALALSDADNSTITGATVQIGAGFVSRYDGLGFIDQNGISGSYNSATGTLTLTGNATVAQYEAALQSVTFGVDPLASTTFGSIPPINPNDFPLTTTSTRDITFTVTDGAVSNAIQTTVTVDPAGATGTPTANNDFLAFNSVANVDALDGNDIIIADFFNNTLNGGAGDDFISSEGGNDVINGGDGDDIISGGGGNDSITGGDGADVFVFFSAGLTGDTDILDYDVLEGDVLDLSNLLAGFDPNASGEPENTIQIVESVGNGESVVTVGGTQVVTLVGVLGTDTVNVIYDSSQAAISVDVITGSVPS